MAELFILVVGLVVSGLMAFFKLAFAILAYSYAACLIPIGIALVLICIMNGIDFWD